MSKLQELTMNDLQEFLDAHSYEDQLKILLIHSEKNRKNIEFRRKKQMDSNDEFELEKKDISEQFAEFLRTKGIKTKFHLVIENIKKGARESREKAKKQIDASKHDVHKEIIQIQSDLEKEFNAFLKAKGLDKKYIVVITEE